MKIQTRCCLTNISIVTADMGNQIQCSPLPGRVKSKLATNMFKVKNINEQGEIIWRGLIEVNRTELVLHQKNGNPIRWPLKSLRRYGFDTGLFSFESGRSCATGPGKRTYSTVVNVLNTRYCTYHRCR